MIRLCIIGNSHAAALKHAAEDFCAEHPDARLTFFAAPSNQTARLAVSDGQYRPRTPELAQQIQLTSGGLAEIDPVVYDAFLIYGFGGRGDRIDNPRRLSASFTRAIVLERVRSSLLMQHSAALRGLSDAPIFAALTPLPAAASNKRRRRLMSHHAEVALVQAELCAPLGVELCTQPEATLVGDQATRADFATGSVPLENALKAREDWHELSERRHMNAAYGRLWLQAFWPRLRAMLGRARTHARTH
ncbi:MAG: hypothetical protein EA407_06880 [Rhodobacteraceae bacterium]|nr:MAG: hypothetical protein EA407_06880 [Paracoccaceae bacterium]